MVDCTLVTCEIVPELDPDDRLLLLALRERGITVSIEIWDDPRVDWTASRLCIVRSTWDYHRRYRDFVAWLRNVSAVSLIKNDVDLLCWNLHKSYLFDLEQRGVPIVPTTWVRRGTACSLAELASQRGWSDVVLKPALGAASHNVTLVRQNGRAFASGQTFLECLAQSEDVLVQPYLHGVVTYGERGLMFFNGSYSHTVVKKPFDRVLTVSDAPSSLIEASESEIAVASAALATLPHVPLYARVDLLRDDRGEPLISELELIEPGLYLAIHEPAQRAFADAIARELAIQG